MAPDEVILVFTNAPDQAVARAIAARAVESRFAACVNILPCVNSVYRWQGKLEEAAEIPLLIKTTRSRYPELEALIRSLHPYALPELIAVDVVAGLPGYLDWLREETAHADLASPRPG